MNKSEQVGHEYLQAEEKKKNRAAWEHKCSCLDYPTTSTLMTQNHMITAALQGNSKHDKRAHEICKGLLLSTKLFSFSTTKDSLQALAVFPKRLGN